MQTLTTLLRVVVMLLVLAIGWKAWQLYGPSSEQLRSMASRVVEVAEEALQGDANSDSAIADPRLVQPTLAEAPDLQPADEPLSSAPPTAAELLPIDKTVEPASYVATADGGRMGQSITRLPEIGAPAPEDSPAGDLSNTSEKSEDMLQSMIAQLEDSGVRDSQLEPWGSSGELYRFSCRVPWGETATFTRHFESIAAEPAAAVEAVVAKIGAWRLSENGNSVLR